MTTLKEVGQSIRHGDWSITIDLRDTFLHVPVHKEYRRYLRFAWMERIYQFKRLPFGLTSSPQVFTDITRPLVEHCRIKGIRVIFYLDDILVLVSTRTLVCQHRDYVLNLLHQVGFKRIQKKCCLTPSQTFPYLEWDSISMQVSLPQTTLDHIRQLIEVITRAPTACTKGCMALLGMMNFATIAIAIGRFYCRPHQFCLPRTRYQQNFNNTKIQLSRRALDSLYWWMSPPENGRTLNVTMPTHVITTDASLSGWGAQMGQQSIQGLWSEPEKLNHINYLELKTVLIALQHWKNQLRNQHSLTTAGQHESCSISDKRGGAHSPNYCII